jgi:hypothetical protein
MNEFESERSNGLHWMPLAALIGILLLAATLRWHNIGRESLGVDELYSVHFATARGPWEANMPAGVMMDPAVNLQSIRKAPPWWRAWTSMGYDTHPPLHAIALRLWMHGFGESDVALRALSLLFTLCTIVFLFDAVRNACGAGPALWTAAIAALAAPQIEFAQEVRSYAMLSAACAAAVAIGVRILVCGASVRRCALFALVSLVAMLTHYWAVGVLAPVAIATLLLIDRQSRVRLAGCIAAAALVFAIVWGPFFWQQRGNFSRNMGWIADHDPGLFPRTLRRAAIVPLRLLFTPPPAILDQASSGAGIAWLPAASLLVLPALALRAHRAAWIFLPAFLGTIFLVAAMDVFQERQTLNKIRFTLHAAVGLLPLLAMIRLRPRGVQAHWVPATVVLACALALPRAWDSREPPWRAYAASAALDSNGREAVVVLRDADRPSRATQTWLGFSRYADLSTRAAVVLEEMATPQVDRALRAKGRAIVLYSEPEVPIERFIAAPFIRVRSGWVPETGAFEVIEFPPE